jgi:predicted nucleic acid-binding protein
VALTHLADTSVLTRTRLPPVNEVVQRLAREGAIARARISDLELGYSARSAAEWDEIIEPLAIFALLETTPDHFRRALQVQRMLAKKHQRGRKVPDLLVAAAAEAKDLVVLHYDADFDRIAAVTNQPCEWVVPAGSVD